MIGKTLSIARVYYSLSLCRRIQKLNVGWAEQSKTQQNQNVGLHCIRQLLPALLSNPHSRQPNLLLLRFYELQATQNYQAKQLEHLKQVTNNQESR